LSGPLEGPHYHYERIGSTNDRARELAEQGAESGTIVTADEQTAGRGRRGRRWAAPPGKALLSSTILRPLPAERHALLPLAVAVAVCAAAEELAPVRCQIKWPNDVWLRERKLAGILIEARPPHWAVIGVGLNLAIPDDDFPPDLTWPATSLGHGVTPEQALAALRRAYGRWLTAEPSEILAEARHRDALQGRTVRWTGAGEAGEGQGQAEGIDDQGNLIVLTDEGHRLTLTSGEVTVRPADG
jgi:BirA family biotin operon repressor/biotin-[acetyl-CoA-carboxylase] ligase